MKPVVTNHAAEAFHVIGFGLPASAQQQLSATFPDCIVFEPSVHARTHARDLCDRLGKTVFFLHLPTIRGEKWLRASAVINIQTVKVIGVHPKADEAVYDRALEAEFAGVLDAAADARTYARAAISVQRGELWFPRGYLSHRTRLAAATMSPTGLSLREEAILALIAAGTTNQDIANQLFVSRETVRWHLRSIYAKLGISDREALCRLARNKFAPANTRATALARSLNS